jgi:putative phosphoesterase
VARIAVLADVHSNADALEAVLMEALAETATIVVAGDVVSGPFPALTVDLLMSLEGARFVLGNADREVIAAFDEGRPFDAAETNPARMTSWDAERITREQRDFLASFESTVEPVPGVLVCHGTPRSDEEIVTRATPDDVLREVLADVGQRLVVGGHTHVQYDRTVDGTRFVNAGSVGLPYEGRPGAYWLLLDDDGVEHRRTEYDVERTAAAIRASDYWNADSLAQTLLEPPTGEDAEAFFEQAAGR